MRVIRLPHNLNIYTCNSYLLLGDWNVLGDVNTLIDPGTDGSVINEIENPFNRLRESAGRTDYSDP